MTQLAGRTAEAAEATASFEDLRAAPHLTLMMRAAKLVGVCGDFLCVIRDVSTTGIRLRLFHKLPPEQKLTLQLANGEHYFVETVWEKDGEAGFRLIAPVDVEAFIAETGPYPKRQLRLAVSLPAMLSAGKATGTAVIHDISQQGACIETSCLLALDQLVKLEAEGLPTLYAKVRWRRHPDYGLVFERTFRLDELARLAQTMQKAGAGTASGAPAQGSEAPARYA